MAGKWRGITGGRSWKPIYLGLAPTLLTVAIIVAGCSGNDNRVFLAPTATPTRSTVTPTPTKAVSPTPTGAASVTPTSTGPTPTATPAKVALWVDNTANGGSNPNVAEFTGATLTSPGVTIVPTPTVKNLSPEIAPDTSGVTFDNSDNQWVSVCGAKGTPTDFGRLAEFSNATLKNLKASPMPTPDVLISDIGSGKSVNCPWAATFDKAGDMWVANSNQNTAAPGFVTEYQPAQLAAPGGSPTPFVTLSDTTDKFVSPTGVLFDPAGDLIVSDFGSSQFGGATAGQILVFSAATLPKVGGPADLTATAKLSDPSTASPVNGALDSAGNLWEADCGASEIYMFPAATITTGATKATVILKATPVVTPNGSENSLNCPGGVTFDSAGNLWFTNFFSTVKGVAGAVGEFTPAQLAASGSPSPTIFLEGDTTMNGLDFPLALTFGPQF